MEYLDTKTDKNDSASCLYLIKRSVQSGRGAWKNEINSVDDHRVWFCIRLTLFSSIGKGYGLPADRFMPTEFEVLIAVFLLLLGVAPLSQGLLLTCPSHL